jgi:hypothetical protein
MKKNQFITLFFLIGTNFILTACLKSSTTSINTSESFNILEVATPTPKPDFSIPEGWVSVPAPKAESKERDCANHTIELERKVELDNGNIKISRYIYQTNEQIVKLPQNLREFVAKNKNSKGYLHIESFENGWLIGADAGEWGGNLFWLNSDGKSKTELLNDNIRGIVKVGKDIFILSGMAHLGIDEGKIYKLTTDEKGTLKIQLLADLKTQPQSFIVENDESFLVALNDKILRIKTSGEIKTLKETNFLYLYPNSMTVTSSGVIYVGMRLFVVRFVPNEKDYTEEWLVPQDCRKFVEKDFDCVCQNGK